MRQFRVLVNGSEYKVAIEELGESDSVTTDVKQPRQGVLKPSSPKPVASGAPKTVNRNLNQTETHLVSLPPLCPVPFLISKLVLERV